MTTATQEDTAPMTSDQMDADEEAGFNSIDPSTAEVKTLTDDAETAPPVAETEASKEGAPPEPKPVIELTQENIHKLLSLAKDHDETKAAHDKRLNDMFGKLGIFEQQFKEGRNGKKVEVTEDDLKELLDEEEGFPVLGKRLQPVLNRILSRVQGGGGDSLSKEQIVQVFEEVEDGKQRARLDKRQKDWQEVIGMKNPVTLQYPDTAYRRWLALQPEEKQKELNNSRDADEIIESIKEFNAYVESTSGKRETPKSGNRMTAREQELRRAVPLKSAGGVASTGAGAEDEDAAMNRGYMAETKQR